jgi:hypothetical protein
MSEDAGTKRHEQVHLLDEREGDLLRLVLEENDDCGAVAGQEVECLQNI